MQDTYFEERAGRFARLMRKLLKAKNLTPEQRKEIMDALEVSENR